MTKLVMCDVLIILKQGKQRWIGTGAQNPAELIISGSVRDAVSKDNVGESNRKQTAEEADL